MKNLTVETKTKGASMQQLTSLSFSHLVADVTVRHQDGAQGVQITLINGYILSLMKGYKTYSSEGTFEVALINDNKLVKSFGNDGVLGWQTVNDIQLIVQEVATL